MKITDTSIEIRLRSPWEAIDLGILLARRHWLLLMTSWAIVTLPIFCLLTALFWYVPYTVPERDWQIPLLPILILWWLKPIFERIPLYILSSVVFNNKPTLKQILLLWLKSLKTNTIADLTIRRFKWGRGFDLAATLLENSRGTFRKRRLTNLHLVGSKAKWLTLIFINFEAIIAIALTTLFFMLNPESSMIPQDNLSNPAISNMPFWLMNILYLLGAMVWIITEPLYIACSFCLYLNRRIQLDGWDIELTFRQLSNRLSQALSIITIACFLTIIGSFSTTLKAEPHTLQLPDENKTVPTTTTNKPLTNIQLERDISKQQMGKILHSPPFFTEKEVTLLRWTNESTDDNNVKEPTDSNNFFSNLLGWLAANFLKTLIWGIVILAVLFVFWQCFKQRPLRATSKKTVSPPPPKKLFGLAITPESLPANILNDFEQLWQQGESRKALSLLYRALLSHLVHQYRLPLKSSHTEGEVVTLTQLLKTPSVTDFTEQLTNQWLQLAYGHYPIPNEQKQQLILGWQLLQTEEEKAP